MHGKKTLINLLKKCFNLEKLLFIIILIPLSGCSTLVVLGVLSSSSKIISNKTTKNENKTKIQDAQIKFIKSKISIKIQEKYPDFFIKSDIKIVKNTLYVKENTPKDQLEYIFQIIKDFPIITNIVLY